MLPDIELKRKSTPKELTPSHNRLVIQKTFTPELMIAEFNEEDNTWVVGSPVPRLNIVPIDKK